MAGRSKIPAMYRRTLNGTLGPRSTNFKALLHKCSLANIYSICSVQYLHYKFSQAEQTHCGTGQKPRRTELSLVVER
jgi:hypothetical protein